MQVIYKYKNDSTYQKKVLQTIYRRKQVSRKELMKILGLGLTSITKFVGNLITDGIVADSGALESSGGRKTNLLSINPEFGYILGIDIGGYAAKFGVVKMDGTIIEDWYIKVGNNVSSDNDLDTEDITPKNLCSYISDIFKKYNKEQFLSICLGISGLVDHDAGRIVFCPNLKGWDDTNIVEILSSEFGLPVFVDNSARCMALAEQRYGAGQDINNQIFISAGTYSISAAMIINSEIYRGDSGFAGEFGHVMSSDKGEKCSCGNYDCLELTATLMMIKGEIAKNSQDNQLYSPLKRIIQEDINIHNLSPEIIKKAIEEGDKLCYSTIYNAGEHIGIALSNILNILNPGAVVFGGSVVEFFPDIIDTVQQTVRNRVLIPIANNIEIKKSVLGWRGAVIGSTLLALEHFFG